MRNWSTDIKNLSKYLGKYTIWKLEQLINFGLGNEKIKQSQLKKYLSKLNIDKKRKNYLEFLSSST